VTQFSVASFGLPRAGAVVALFSIHNAVMGKSYQD